MIWTYRLHLLVLSFVDTRVWERIENVGSRFALEVRNGLNEMKSGKQR